MAGLNLPNAANTHALDLVGMFVVADSAINATAHLSFQNGGFQFDLGYFRLPAFHIVRWGRASLGTRKWSLAGSSGLGFLWCWWLCRLFCSTALIPHVEGYHYRATGKKSAPMRRAGTI